MMGGMAMKRKKTRRAGLEGPAPEIAALETALRTLLKQMRRAPPRETARLAPALSELTGQLTAAHEAQRERERAEADVEAFLQWEEYTIKRGVAAGLKERLDEALALFPGDASAALQHLRTHLPPDPERPDPDQPMGEPDPEIEAAARRFGVDG